MLRISIEMASVLIYIYGYMIEEISQIMQMDIDLTVISINIRPKSVSRGEKKWISIPKKEETQAWRTHTKLVTNQLIYVLIINIGERFEYDSLPGLSSYY